MDQPGVSLGIAFKHYKGMWGDGWEASGVIDRQIHEWVGSDGATGDDWFRLAGGKGHKV